MKEEKEDKTPKMVFKDYYNNLSESKKVELRNELVPKYLRYPTFYSKLSTNVWTPLELEKLKEITGLTFKLNNEEN